MKGKINGGQLCAERGDHFRGDFPVIGLMRKSIGERFEEMSRLYHFTSFDAACDIIKSRQLRFGKMSRMNDLIESSRIVFSRLLTDNLPEKDLLAEEEMQRYQQISFIQDGKRDGFEYLGFDLHTMWGLYAESGYGACLVFDKNKLQLGDGDYARDVEYDNLILADFVIKNKSKAGIKSEIWRRRDEIFFYKRKEWEYEQEYRIIRRAENERDDEYLDISDALSFVIICKDETVEKGESIWDGNQCYILQHLKRRIPVLAYEYDIDGYTLNHDGPGDPIWAEQVGFF